MIVNTVDFVSLSFLMARFLHIWQHQRKERKIFLAVECRSIGENQILIKESR